MKARTLILAAVAALAIPAAAFAQAGPGWTGGGMQPRLRADLNGDGMVTAEEHAEFRAGRPMLRADLNGDGVVTADERASVGASGQTAWPCPLGGGGDYGRGAGRGAGRGMGPNW